MWDKHQIVEEPYDGKLSRTVLKPSRGSDAPAQVNYNRRLQAMIAIELKIGEFQPEYKGKMEFYLNILNDTVKLPHENPAIGIIICKSKSRMIVEYALKSSNMPIGVATYSLSSELPEAYKKLLPTSEEIAKKIELLIER